jgi:type II secretion system protein G
MLRLTCKSSKAFTLTELLIAMVIMSILAMIAIPKFSNRTTTAKTAAAQSDLKLLRFAIQMYQTDTGLYPTVLSDLIASTQPANGLSSAGVSTAIASGWNGPYIQTSLPTEPNGGSWTYTVTGASTGTVVDSYNTSW